MENNPINTAKRYEAYFFLLYTSIINKGILIKGFKIKTAVTPILTVFFFK